MVDPGWALQKAVYAHLSGDAALLAILGAQKVYDHVPRSTPKPYVTFADGTVRDWSTDGEAGHEHDLALAVWAGAKGRKETAAVLEAIREALHERHLALDGHRLVNLRQTTTTIRRSDDGETVEGLIRFRAVTEVA